MIALPSFVRKNIQTRFEATEQQILTTADKEPLVAEMLFRQWSEGMEAALREAETGR